jgi:hypothetical protein
MNLPLKGFLRRPFWLSHTPTKNSYGQVKDGKTINRLIATF